jgi:sigma-B regulation protein RsbU (phosphoserine phosphatase)
VLVADDQGDVVLALRMLLRDAGLETDAAMSVSEVRQRLDRHAYDLLLMDLNYARDTTSGREGLQLLTEVRERFADLPVVVMTGWGSIETAVEAMRRGARTFVTKPWDNTALAETIAREVADGRAAREADRCARREHEEAQRIQRGLLPASLPARAGLELAARWEPALAFGGDWYDVVAAAPHRVAISIADVCGKGLPAAFLMANLQASARALALAGVTPDALASSLNRQLARMDAPRRLVTGFCSFYDERTRELTFTNAGHNPPLMVKPDGAVEPLTTGGMVLGAFEESSYQAGTVTLEPGARLVLYTDGITEAENADREPFGESRLTDTIARHRTGGAGPLVAGIFDEVAAFARRPLQDDATVLAVAVAE